MMSLLWLIFVFNWKIPIYSGIGNGIRIDDVLFIPLAIAIFVSGKFLYALRIKKLVLLYGLFTAVALLSMAVNAIFLEKVSITFSALNIIRPIQYSLVFFLPFFDPRISHSKVFKLYTIYVCIIVVIQKFGYLGQFSQFNAVERPSGNTGGPYELAIICAFLVFYFLYRRNYLFLFANIGIIFVTNSRITILVVCFIVFFYSFRVLKVSRVHKAMVSSAVMIFILFLLVALPKERARFISVFSSDYLTYIEFLNTNIPECKSQEDFIFYDRYVIKSNLENEFSGDPSLFSRFSRWFLVYKTLLTNGIWAIAFGMGPGFFGLALDGQFVRVLGEVGVVGLTIWIFVLYEMYKIVRRSPTAFSYFLALLGTSFFIDIFLSYKAMIFLWFVLGDRVSRRALDE